MSEFVSVVNCPVVRISRTFEVGKFAYRRCRIVMRELRRAGVCKCGGSLTRREWIIVDEEGDVVPSAPSFFEVVCDECGVIDNNLRAEGFKRLRGFLEGACGE